MTELTKSVIKDGKFYLGQTELKILIMRIIRYYRYRNNNADPEAIVIPLLKEVEGVRIEYETEPIPTKPRTGRTGSLYSGGDSKE